MEKIERIDKFLKLISEIKKSGILIDSNLVYSNLVLMDVEKISVKDYFTHFIDMYQNNKNMDVYSDNNYCYFNSKNNNNDSYSKLKIHIALDKWHLYNSVKLLLDYINTSNIICNFKVFKDTRIDNIVIRVNSISDSEKIRNFINNDEYIKSGLICTNPFMFTDDNISYTWDGNLSYNLVVADWISRYINDSNDDVSSKKLLSYIYKNYGEIFINGKNINSFARECNMQDYALELVNYKRITELLIISLAKNNLKDFYQAYQTIIDNNKKEQLIDDTRLLLDKDSKEVITSNEEEAFDYSFVKMCKKENPKSTVKRFNYFIKTNDYRVFTRDNNIRKILQSSINTKIVKELIFKEQKNCLINASVETLNKYDITQVTKALFELKNNIYDGFTNNNNARDNLKLFINKDNIDETIHQILIDNNYKDISLDEEYWVYIEYIKKLVEEKKK